MPLWFVVGIATLGVAACGGTEQPQQQASPTADAQDQMLQYVRCMREHGVDMPEDENATGFPKPAGGEAALQAAEAACRPFAPPKLQEDGKDPAAQDRLIQIARCLRERGVDVPDPQPGQGLRMPPGSANNQRTQQAIDECSKPSAKTGS